jgi:hypothetical protein
MFVSIYEKIYTFFSLAILMIPIKYFNVYKKKESEIETEYPDKLVN